MGMLSSLNDPDYAWVETQNTCSTPVYHKSKKFTLKDNGALKDMGIDVELNDSVIEYSHGYNGKSYYCHMAKINGNIKG